MDTENLIVAREDLRIVDVDYEDLAPGHWAFDIAHLIASISRSPHRVDVVKDTREVFRTALQDLDPAGRDLFLGLTDLLVDISRAVHRDRGPA
jgi:hypothetical protein